ncbi:hypothetical protein UVI_02019910 [Ustilaginoidea virens]|uniref:ubiquitinyl hydrolase 1 n=1 Tax=Ustilaginoidea virens TaxID=1159556 RepID=A0A1B5L2B7_USTVR|nr:hypothetical protein UVI_02019910 [Ustilaginoidea virens]
METPRRNPKRKLSETADVADGIPDDPLGEACRPLTPQEIEDWKGWVELESEPRALLPSAWMQAVLKKHCGQTTNNACATVALLNILMNARDIDLGQQLTEFRERTRSLSTSLRGHSISSNAFIRTIHNSFTRRMDHLNADLCLENEARKRSNRRRQSTLEYGYHFIAYVPFDGHVWELDGLQSCPLKLGPVVDADWTAIAKPQIEARMFQYQGSQLSFNLLAVCGSSLLRHGQTIATMVAAMQVMQMHFKDGHNPMFNNLVSSDEHLLDMTKPTQLTEFNLTLSDIQNAELPAELKLVISRPSWLVEEDACDVFREIQSQLKAAINEYRIELSNIREDEGRVRSRKRDYGGALHCWVKKLAHRGVLEDIIKMSV